jgi:hypothetical protein
VTVRASIHVCERTEARKVSVSETTNLVSDLGSSARIALISADLFAPDRVGRPSKALPFATYRSNQNCRVHEEAWQ